MRPTAPHRGRRALALSITFVALVVEIWGAMWTGSLALLADAGHMLSDVAALSITLAAAWFAGRPHTWSSTFGLHRTEVLAATGNTLRDRYDLHHVTIQPEGPAAVHVHDAPLGS